MRSATGWKVMFSVFVAAVFLAGATGAEDKKKDAKAHPSAREHALYGSLRDVINHGANLYNQGDWNGCYHLWEGALMSVKPLLSKHGKLQKTIDDGLANARQDPVVWHRAWVLRAVLDDIRGELKGKASPGKDDDKPLTEKKPKKDDHSPVTTDKPKPKTLWQRLGGEPGVSKIVDDFVNLAAPDPKVDFLRGGKVKMTADQVIKMKREIVEQISQASGGPLKYKGPDMKKVHKGMGITDAQFKAIAADLKKALEQNHVAADDVKKVLHAVNGYRKQIVEPKKKPDDKKPNDKKPADKKPTDKKPTDKKPGATASVTGKVTYKGKPVPNALIAFVGSGGFAVGAVIGADGSYTAEKLKPGEYKIAIDPPRQKPGAAKAVVIPKKYTSVVTSGLTYTVKDGKQNHDIKLAD